jgi:hypothetical protein
VELICKPSKLQELELGSFKMTAEVGHLLFTAMQENCYLTHLGIYDAEMPSSAFQKFIAYFKEDFYLKTLNLKALKGLHCRHWLPFFEALAHNKSLRNLVLSENSFVEDQREAQTKL